MPSWALKLLAFCATLAVFAGSLDYAAGHVKNVQAPLQPPVADRPLATLAPATATPVVTLPPLVTQRPGARTPPPAGSGGPLLTIQPGVRQTALPSLSITHVS